MSHAVARRERAAEANRVICRVVKLNIASPHSAQAELRSAVTPKILIQSDFAESLKSYHFLFIAPGHAYKRHKRVVPHSASYRGQVFE